MPECAPTIRDSNLRDPSFMQSVAEFNDDINLQILSIFPGFILQQIHNALAVRQIVPRGVDKMDLNWTYLGFADDTPELRAMRLKQANLAGPAGFVSMEDGAVGGFVQRGIAAADERDLGRRDGRRRRRDVGDPRDRGLGARLLEGLARAYGRVGDDRSGRPVRDRRTERGLRGGDRCRPAGGMAGVLSWNSASTR